jgi:ATP-binding cassette subfamily F protein 3
MNSCEALISALKDYSGTLCFISHDLYFINSICDNIIYVKDGSVKIYPGNYDYFDLRRKDEGKEENKIQISKNKEIDWDERKEKKNEARRKERRMEDIEKKLLPKILDEIKKLGEELSKPEVYGDYSKAAELSKKVSELQRQKEALESELLSLIEEDLI